MPDGTFAKGNQVGFTKGISGNPGGFSGDYKKRLNKMKMKQLEGAEEVFDFYVQYMKSYINTYGTVLTPSKEVHAVARTVMDFGLAKPAQSMEMEDLTGSPIGLSGVSAVEARAALNEMLESKKVMDYLKSTGEFQKAKEALEASQSQTSTTTKPEEESIPEPLNNPKGE